MKKKSRLLIATALFLALTLNLSALAAPAASLGVSLVPGASSVKPGDTLAVQVKVTGVDTLSGGLSAFGPLDITYDKSAFEFASLSKASTIPDGDLDYNQLSDTVLRSVYIDNSSAQNNPIKADGVVYTVNFKVKDTAAPGTAQFTVSGRGFTDHDLNVVSSVQFTNATVTIAAKPASSSAPSTAGTTSSKSASGAASSSKAANPGTGGAMPSVLVFAGLMAAVAAAAVVVKKRK